MLAGMQTIWKGAISFGLVNIPVRLFAATEQRDIAFRQVHAADGGRIRYRRVCTLDEQEVSYAEVAKGYELPDGDIVVLSDEDLANLPLPTSRAIEVLEFVPLGQIDAIYANKAYYLAPDSGGAKPYVLLRQALERAGKVAVVKVALRQREHLAFVRPRDGALVLQTMLWPDEIRQPEAVVPTEEVELRPQEVDMAGSYIEALSGDFQPSDYTDDYRAALEEVIAAKTAGREIRAAEEEPGPGGEVVDLMSALQASVEEAQRRRGESGPTTRRGGRGGRGKPAAEEAAPTTRRRTPAKQAASRKDTKARGSKGESRSGRKARSGRRTA